MSELVSVIMPAYNSGRYIAESIKSVIAQTYTNWELIIMDDCSTDNTKEIVTSYNDSRIKYLCNEKNSGAAVSRNRALEEAKGRWIAFLDSDDLWLPTKLEKQIAFMEENKYAFSYTNSVYIDEEGKEVGLQDTGPTHITKIGMFLYNWIGTLTAMYDGNEIGIVQIADVKKRNDYAIWLKVIKEKDCYLFDENMAKYRRRSGSLSNVSYFALLYHHYTLFYKAEQFNKLSSIVMVVFNMFFGCFKKLFYVKKYTPEEE